MGKTLSREWFEWDSGAFHLDKVSRKVTGAYLLSDPAHKSLKLTRNGDSLEVQLPAQAPDAVASVLVLKTAK